MWVPVIQVFDYDCPCLKTDTYNHNLHTCFKLCYDTHTMFVGHIGFVITVEDPLTNVDDTCDESLSHVTD